MLTSRLPGRAAAALALTALVVAPASFAAVAPPPATLQEGLRVVQVVRFGGQMFDGMMGGLLRRAGMPEEMEQTITVNGAGTKQRIDTRDRSTVIDLDAEQIVDLDHKKKKATVTTFEVMRERLRQAAEGMSNLPQMEGPQGEGDAEVVVTMDMSVESAGPVQHGPFAAEEFHQTIAFHSATPEGEDLGTFVLYNVMRVSDAYDNTPLETFGRNYAARLGEMFEGTGGMGAAMAALMGNERFREAIAEAAKGFEQMGDRAPVYTHMAMLTVPPGLAFDPAKAFAKPEKKGGGLGGMLGAMTGLGGDAPPPAEQATTVITESDTRSAGPFAAGDEIFAVPANYKVEQQRN